jgi:hypothetical protein
MAGRRRFDERPALASLNGTGSAPFPRALLPEGLGAWLAESDLNRTQAPDVLDVTLARVLDSKRGTISSFILNLLDLAPAIESVSIRSSGS